MVHDIVLVRSDRELHRMRIRCVRRWFLLFPSTSTHILENTPPLVSDLGNKRGYCLGYGLIGYVFQVRHLSRLLIIQLSNGG